MNDLDAPLGQSPGARRRSTTKRDQAEIGTRYAAKPRNRTGRMTIGLVAAGVIGLNAYALAARDTLPQTALITLDDTPAVAMQTTGSTVSADPAPAHGVEIVYQSTGSDTDAADAPPPRSDDEDYRISRDGPRVIVVRDPAEATAGQPLQLAHLPDDEALEASEWGELPVRTADGRRPMDIYARPWSRAGGKRIAIVIGGLGLSQTGTQQAIRDLPPEITLAFAPQGNSLNRWMRKARSKGHELLVQVPMEPFNYPQNDPGPQTLLAAGPEADNIDKLRWALGRLTNYTGIVNYLGGRFSADEAAVSPILREIGQRGLLYLNDGTAGNERLQMLARAYDVPYLSGQIVLDTSQDPTAIKARLKQLEEYAEGGGYAVGTGSALQPTVDTVAAWANDAKKRGFEIVGVSALAR
ncbi:divergent polysaccharide deacetylase family protein [Oricola sp.]|uniref:divergent polysaccharide deacetylase family protein n=1 Tax=Oricola sp. TaxID=1979950 RepID=UPI003BACD234